MKMMNYDINVEVKMEPTTDCYPDTIEIVDQLVDENCVSEKQNTLAVESGVNSERKITIERKSSETKITETKEMKIGDEIHRLRVKLDKLKNPDTPQKNKQMSTDRDQMAFTNTKTIVNFSYVCPFYNRISSYYCYYCKVQFMNPIELREHTISHDPIQFEGATDSKKSKPKIDITRIDCRFCLEKIDNIDTFKDHIEKVHGKMIYPVTNEFLKFRLTLNNLTCTECDRVFPYFDSLKKHMIDHFGTLTCDICGTCFLEPGSLRTHIKSHNKNDVYFPCEICGKNLKSKYYRALHISTIHEKKPFVNCYKCDASFLSYALRNRHLIEVHGDKRTFPCKLCDKVYKSRKSLMEHNKRHHQCDLCDQKFYLPSSLKKHKVTHTGERNFRCEICDRSYISIKSLQKHRRSHTSERKFKCDICNTAFSQSGILKSHMKSHHPGLEMDGN